MFHNEDNWPVEYSTVKSVDHYEEGGFAITQDSGWSFFVRAEEANKFSEVILPGDEVIVLGGLGQQIRGIFIRGREYRYVSKAQAEAEFAAWLANYEREKREAFEANISDWLARKNRLSGPFYQRIQRFEDKDFVEFWKESGAYELFAVEQANALYHLAMRNDDPVAWLEKFYALDWSEQREVFPDLDEGHSGNTFGAMVGLAKAVARGESI